MKSLLSFKLGVFSDAMKVPCCNEKAVVPCPVFDGTGSLGLSIAVKLHFAYQFYLDLRPSTSDSAFYQATLGLHQEPPGFKPGTLRYFVASRLVKPPCYFFPVPLPQADLSFGEAFELVA